MRSIRQELPHIVHGGSGIGWSHIAGSETAEGSLNVGRLAHTGEIPRLVKSRNK
jgi:hypothetical protein